MKLIKIIDAREVVASLSDDNNIGTNLCYRFMKFMLKTDNDAAFFNKKLEEIVNNYGVRGDDGNLVVPEEKTLDFNRAYEELKNTEADDPCVKFPLSEISKGLNLSMKQMYPLFDFIDEDK